MNIIEIGDELYPKFDVMDENGHPIRDARFYQIVSRNISSFNKIIKSNYKYSHFKNNEEEE